MGSQDPMGRAGEPEGPIGAIVLFCSDAGRFITGSGLLVSGKSSIFARLIALIVITGGGHVYC